MVSGSLLVLLQIMVEFGQLEVDLCFARVSPDKCALKAFYCFSRSEQRLNVEMIMKESPAGKQLTARLFHNKGLALAISGHRKDCNPKTPRLAQDKKRGFSVKTHRKAVAYW